MRVWSWKVRVLSRRATAWFPTGTPRKSATAHARRSRSAPPSLPSKSTFLRRVATDSSTADLLTTVQAAADAAGWEVFSLDDEGFEAELLARDDAGELLGVNLRDGACPGQVLVAVSVTDYAGLS